MTKALALGLLVGLVGFAQADSIGTSAGQVLKLGSSARGAALGEALSTLPQESDAIYWNPAGLGNVYGQSAVFAHTDYLQKFFYDFGSYSHSIENYGTIGLAVQYLSSDKIDETNNAGATVGTYRFTDQVFALGYGKNFVLNESNTVALGLTTKWVRSKIIETANTGAVDVGALWHYQKNLTFGAAAQNMGGKLEYNREGSQLPLNFKLGASYRWPIPLVTALDVNFPRDNDPNVAFGSEYELKIVDGINSFLRAGYNSTNTSDLSGLTSASLGGGLSWRSYRVDFAWVPFGRLGNTYRFGLTAKWGESK